MLSIFTNTVIGFCWWDIPALIILIAVIAVFAVKHRNLKKEEKELEDQLSGTYAKDAIR